MATVTIEQGKLKGGATNTDSGLSYYEFLCVPYAKPPIGNLRFKSPQPPEPWNGERDATTVNKDNISMQVDLFRGGINGTEDCLYLNVYTPKLPDSNSKLLPVMFYIHGGGFVFGNGIVKDELGPEYLIENDVVVVTINYRLGVFGFLSLDVPEATGNMGLKDQVQALRWVQSNIEYFGGDKNNVTIFGTSAGSASVEYHILSPLSKGLFHKAIMQSGSALSPWAINYEPKRVLNLFLEELGYKGSINDVEEIYQYLFTSTAESLTEASQKLIDKFTADRFFFGFVPIIEKDLGTGDLFISDNPYRLLKEGKFAKVPVIKGFCDKEGYFIGILKPQLMLDLIENKQFLNRFAFEIQTDDKEKLSADLFNAYVEATSQDDEKDKMGVDFFGDLNFIAGSWVSGNIMANYGSPVYFYELSYNGAMNLCKHLFGIMKKGASHGDDLTYIFKHNMITKFATDKDIIVRSNVTKMWTNFAKTNVPTAKDWEVDWPTFSTASPVYLNIDEKLTIKSNYQPKRMAVFKGIYDKYKK